MSAPGSTKGTHPSNRFKRRFKASSRVALHALSFDVRQRPLSVVAWAFLAGAGYAADHASAFAIVAIPTLALFLILVAITTFDAIYFIIPNSYIGIMVLAGLATAMWSNPGLIPDRLCAAVLGYGLITGLNIAYRILRGRDGIGRGDAKLFGAAGLWIGLDGLPSVMLYAALSGLASTAGRRVGDRQLWMSSAIPFGPHLALGTWLVWLLGPLTFLVQ